MGGASSMDEALGQFMNEFELTNQVINNTAATLHYRDALKVKKHAVSAVSACFSYVPVSKHIQQEANEKVEIHGVLASSGIIHHRLQIALISSWYLPLV